MVSAPGRSGAGARARLPGRDWLHGSPDTDVTAKIADLLLPAELSSGVLPLLGMGRDVPDGRMYLRDGHLAIDWRKASGSEQVLDRLRNTSRDFATALSAASRTIRSGSCGA